MTLSVTMEAQYVPARYCHIFAIIAQEAHSFENHKFPTNGDFEIYVISIWTEFPASQIFRHFSIKTFAIKIFQCDKSNSTQKDHYSFSGTKHCWRFFILQNLTKKSTLSAPQNTPYAKPSFLVAFHKICQKVCSNNNNFIPHFVNFILQLTIVNF